MNRSIKTHWEQGKISVYKNTLDEERNQKLELSKLGYKLFQC